MLVRYQLVNVLTSLTRGGGAYQHPLEDTLYDSSSISFLCLRYGLVPKFVYLWSSLKRRGV